mmetsp:Transcript_15782/g.47094  ORF Transcript_15782/g.47094 Transcript_15782/m.47094 type:complete len:250 (+) Transcript_15782:355-1104(+)
MTLALLLYALSSSCEALELSRRTWLLAPLGAAPLPACAASYQTSIPFEGGAGGLSKTKPNTGVRVADRADTAGAARPETRPPGPVSERLFGRSGLPVDVSFTSPWATSAGLVSRDYQTGDGAFVLVAPAAGKLEKAVEAKLFAKDGKYGSYGAPSDVKLRRTEPRGETDVVYEYSFVALTPAMREVEKRVRARAVVVGGDAYVLVAGSTANRWKAAEPNVVAAVDSFAARPAPEYSAEMTAYRRKGGGE